MYYPPYCQDFIPNQYICPQIRPKNAFREIFFVIVCNITVTCAIIHATMVGAMAKKVHKLTENDDLVLDARTNADALGRLYEIYYERIFRFCVYRLFRKEIAQDITSSVFLEVARGMRSFKGRTRQDFCNWLYAIAANQSNAYIRKTLRRRKLLVKATESKNASACNGTDDCSQVDWSGLYTAILKLKPQHQTIVTLRFFENLSYEQIAGILKIKEATLRVTLHRILNQLRNHLLTVTNGEI